MGARKKVTATGFTLLEVLVAIVIVSLITTITLVSLEEPRAKTRDAKRLADIKKIQQALEFYASDHYGFYPEANPFGDAGNELGVDIQRITNHQIIGWAGSPVYMAKVPTDPLQKSTDDVQPCLPDGSSVPGDCNPVYAVNGLRDYYQITFYLERGVGSLGPGMQRASPFGIASCTPQCDGAPAPPGPVLTLGDLNNDGNYTGTDIEIALNTCDPLDCHIQALPVTYNDVGVSIPPRITGNFAIEGAGIGQTIFRAPVPVIIPAIFWVTTRRANHTFKNFTLDGRKGDQPNYSHSYGNTHGGIMVDNPSALNVGPGLVENIEFKDFLTTGFGDLDGKNWIVRNNIVHDIGCVDLNWLPCPNLTEPDPTAVPFGWQTTGYGIIFTGGATGGIAYNNTVRDVNKLGIESFYSDNFHFYNNTIRRTGTGLTSNGGENGIIEYNVVEDSVGHGIACGDTAANVTYRGNTIVNSGQYGMNLQCKGDNLTVVQNVITNSCTNSPGFGGNVIFASVAGNVARSHNWMVKENTINDTKCENAVYLTSKDFVVFEDNNFTVGKTGMYVEYADNVTIRSSNFTVSNPIGIKLIKKVDEFTIESDVAITGCTVEAVRNYDPSTVTNVVINTTFLCP